jgi:hypothetical protein
MVKDAQGDRLCWPRSLNRDPDCNRRIRSPKIRFILDGWSGHICKAKELKPELLRLRGKNAQKLDDLLSLLGWIAGSREVDYCREFGRPVRSLAEPRRSIR